MRLCTIVLALVTCFFAAGCAVLHGVATAFEPEAGREVFVYEPVAGSLAGEHAELLLAWAPVWTVAAGASDWNRIGTPTLRAWGSSEKARVDPRTPAVFCEVRTDRVGERDVLQLVYRVHFEQFGFTPKAFYALHRNAGLLGLVTLDAATHEPLFVTSVHTCGCYLALVPTTTCPDAVLPVDWPHDEVEVVGRRLNARPAAPVPGSSRVVFALASRSHRVVSQDTRSELPAGERVPLPLRAMSELRRLPVEGRAAETASFFYERGFMKGHVKGAWSLLEGLFVGTWLLDPRLGTDKDFGAPGETGARFYTAIAPWRREASRLDRLTPLLVQRGFRVTLP